MKSPNSESPSCSSFSRFRFLVPAMALTLQDPMYQEPHCSHEKPEQRKVALLDGDVLHRLSKFFCRNHKAPRSRVAAASVSFACCKLANSTIALLWVPIPDKGPFRQELRLDSPLDSRQSQEDLKIMGFDRLKSLELRGRIGKPIPLQRTTDSGLQRYFHGVTGKIHGAVEALPPKQHSRVI